MRRIVPWFLHLILALPAVSLAGEARVDLKNEASMALSVPLGTDNVVTKESDFAVLAADGGTVRIYPFELYRNMFWSQPLTAGSFSRVAEGNPVRPVTLEKEDHEELRAKGEARKGELLAAQEEARREAVRREAGALKERLTQLEARRDDLTRRISSAEQTFLAEEANFAAAWGAFDATTEQSLQNIQEYLGQREELLERRYPASARRPSPSTETGRLDARIRQLDGQIASERENLRAARDGRRAARSAFLARRQEWQRLLGERNQVASEIHSVGQRIRELPNPR